MTATASNKIIDTAICKGSSIVVGGQTFTTTGNYPITLSKASYTGCDSTINLKLSVIDITAVASKSGDLSCETPSVTLSATVSTVSPNTATVSYVWKNASGTIIGSTPSVAVTPAGIFTLIVRGSIGYTCEKSTTISVTRSGVVPNRPELRGDVVTCEGRAINYMIANPAAEVLKFNWIVQNGTINSGTGTSNVSLAWDNVASGKICVNAENACGTSDTACLSVEIGKKPGALSISGGINVCPASTATYSVASSSTVKTYQWLVPAGANIVRGLNTNSIDVNWGTSTGGDVCVAANNDCGTAQTCLTVTVKNASPDSIPLTGPKTVCPSATDTIKAEVNAAITKYVWSVPANATIVSGQNTPSVIVRFDSGSEAVVVLEIENACQLKRQERHLVTIKSTLPDSLPILGVTTICSHDTSSFGVSGNATITGYKWTIPTGATIVSGQNTQTIRIAWGTATSGQVCVELTNACNLKRNICSNITLKNATIDTFSIKGAAEVCPGSSGIYSITPNPKFQTFNWIIPSNATVLSGLGTSSINVMWNTNGRNAICLDVTNDCNVKRRNCLMVDVKVGIDSLLLTGTREVCENTNATFTLQNDPDALSYFWSVPTGARIESGRGTNQIVVRFGTNGGQVIGSALGGCALNPSSIFVSIKKAPDAPASITGAATVCQGETAKYFATRVANIRSYKWQVPTGAFIMGSDSSEDVVVLWLGDTGGKLTVKTINDCLESPAKSFDVMVNRVPQPKAGVDDSTCGRQYVLKGSISIGTHAWRLVQKPTDAVVTFADSTRQNSAVSVTKSGIYFLKFEEKNGQCIVSDTVSLFFRESPKLTLINDNCNSDGSQFVLNANINGAAPFTFRSGQAGTILGNTFTSSPITEGSTYTLIVQDAFGCESPALTGLKKCPCTTQAVVLKNKQIVACFGQNGRVEVQTNGVLNSTDIFEYVLHDGSATNIGTILQTNQTGAFNFDAAKMQYERTYFIHYRVGTNNNGVVSTAARCYAVSNGISVIFKNKITASLKGDTVICANSSTVLTLNTTASSFVNMTFLNVKENASVTVNNVKNNNISTVTPSISTVYKLIEVTDPSGCPAQIGDSVTVNIRPKLQGNAGVDQIVCVKNAQLAATIPPQYKASWRSLSGADVTLLNSGQTTVTNLKNGKNTFILTAQDTVCAAYRSFDSISIFLPLIPKAVNLSLEMWAGDTIKRSITEEAPQGTYSVTRLTNPENGRFDIFSNGSFTYIAQANYSGIAKFRFMICSEACTNICDSGDVRILVKPKPIVIAPIVIDVPNAITPNDDGKNDVLVIDNIEKFPQGELMIFNRWGDILYRSKPYKNDWNGTNQKGDPLPEGTYYYILRLDINNSKILRGDMTILR